MGQAKQKRLFAQAGLCICASNKPAGECCFNGKFWHKPATILKLDGGSGGAHADCYLREFNSCSSKISGEHLVSKAVLQVIQQDGLIVSGVPWKDGDWKVGLDTLRTNCLCTTHNSALSTLDSEAGRFFDAIRKCDGHTGSALHYIFSGHDIERWILKTLVAMATAKSLAENRIALSGEFHGKVDIGAMLQDPFSWPATTGLYFTLKKGDRFMRLDHFQFQPLFNDADRKIAGVLLSIQGITFSLFITPVRGPMIDDSSYRPSQIQMKSGPFLNTIELSWNDGRKHRPVTMELVAKHGEYDPATAKRGLSVGPLKQHKDEIN